MQFFWRGVRHTLQCFALISHSSQLGKVEISTTCHLLDIICVCRRLVAARGKPTAWADRQSEGTQGSEHVASCCCSSLWDLLSTFHTVHMKAESFFAPLLAMCDPDLWRSLPAKRLLWAWRGGINKNGFVVCGDFLFLFFDTTCQRSRFLLLLLQAVCSELLAV